MSGSTLGGIAGGVIGFWIGGPQGAQIGYTAGSLIGGYLDPEVIKGPSLGDMPVQTSQEGVPRPIIFGSPQPFPGNIIQIGPKDFRTKRERQGSGKGGGPVVESQEVYQSYAIRICQGEVTVITVWRDGKVVYDLSGTFPLDGDASAFMSRVRFYTGSETQMPDPTMEAIVGSSNQPAYRGTAYMVVTGDNLTNTGGRIPNYEFRVAEVAEVTNDCDDPCLYNWFPLDGAGTEIVNGKSITDMSDTGAGWGGAMSVDSAGSMTFGEGGWARADWPLNTFDVGDNNEVGWTIVLTFRNSSEDGGSERQQIVANKLDDVSGGHNWSFSLNGGPNDRQIEFSRSHDLFGSNDVLRTSYDASVGTVYHCAARWVSNDPSNPSHAIGDLTLHVQGRIEATVADVNRGAVSGNYLAFGGSEDFPATFQFRGSIADVRIYRCALSDEQIARMASLTAEDWIEAPDAPGTFVNYRTGDTYTSCASRAVVGSAILSDIELRIARMAGVRASQFDVSADTGVLVHGIGLLKQMPAADAIRVLGGAYFRDYPEFDLQIHSTPRGGASVVTIADNDCIDSTQDEEVRGQATELPRKLNLYFSDPGAAYAIVPVPAERTSINVPSQGVMGIQLPMVFPRNEAKRIAEKTLKIMWEEQTGSKFVRELPLFQFAYLTPADPFQYNQKRWRITKLTQKETTIQIEAVRDRSRNLESEAEANEVLPPTVPTTNIKGPTILQIVQIPPLRSADAKPGVYAAVTGLTPGWPGADLYMRVGTDGQWVRLRQMVASATMGHLVEDVAQDSNGMVEPVVVLLYDNATLDNATPAEITSGANAFAITTSGVSEIGQFATAVDDSGGHWNLSDITNPLNGTSAATHNVGDPFLLLDNNIYFIPLEDTRLSGETLYFAAPTIGTPIENAPVQSIVFEPPTFIVDGGEVEP